MNAEGHIQTARSFLEAADKEFAAGDHMQASEKLWDAATHAVIAVAQQNGWQYGSHRAMKTAVDMMAEEYDEPLLVGGFGVAEKFHANFYHDFMEDYQLDADRPKIRDFVHRVIALMPENGATPGQ